MWPVKYTFDNFSFWDVFILKIKTLNLIFYILCLCFFLLSILPLVSHSEFWSLHITGWTVLRHVWLKYVYWLKNKNHLDATYYFIVLLIGSTCFGQYCAHHQELATIMLITTLVVSFCNHQSTTLKKTHHTQKNTTITTHKNHNY